MTSRTSFMILALAAAAAPGALSGESQPASVKHQITIQGTDAAVAGRLAEADHNADQARHLMAAGKCFQLAGLIGGGTVPAGDALLEAARRHWNGVLFESLQLIEESGDTLILATPGHLVQVRFAVRERMAAMPAEVLRTYRALVDDRARHAYDQGRSARALRLLQRVLADTPLSSVESAVLDQLGDLNFARGAFAEAARCWQRAGSVSGTDPDRARLQAKRVLALWFQGDHDACARAIDAMTRDHRQATGTLAGRTGSYLDIVRAELREVGPGTAAATGALSRIQWSTPLRDSPGRERAEPPKVPAQPLVLANAVVVSDGHTIRSFAANTGGIRWMHAGPDAPGPIGPRGLSFADGRLFGILSGGRTLVCVDAATGKTVWQRSTGGLPALPWFEVNPAGRFDGEPLTVEDQVVAGIASTGDESTVGVVCYHARTGVLVWRQSICKSGKARNPGAGGLLARAGQFIIYNTPCGVVAALDAETGRIAWALQPAVATSTAATPEYRAKRSDQVLPCLYADGRLYLVPGGDRRLWCLEAETGRVKWRATELDVDHLIGVGAGRLVLATEIDLRAIDIRSGAVEWRQPPEGALASAGQGFMTSEHVVWPTVDGLQMLDLATGAPACDPAMWDRVPTGTLSWDGRRLVVATFDRLLMFGESAEAKGAPR